MISKGFKRAYRKRSNIIEQKKKFKSGNGAYLEPKKRRVEWVWFTKQDRTRGRQRVKSRTAQLEINRNQA